MPGSNLTRIEAEERKAVIEAPIHYHVDLDLTVGAKNFGSKSFICFNAKPGSSTFLDLIADEVTSIDLNGKTVTSAQSFAQVMDGTLTLNGGTVKSGNVAGLLLYA